MQPTTLTCGRTVYEVTPLSEDPHKIAYALKGPRSAYHLLRNQHNPHRLFAVNDRGFTHSTPFDGRWFADDNGDLRLL